jgi:MSHA biogenesis protein MshE
MGAPHYLLASALHAVVAQRLVRKICRNCAQPDQPTGAALGWLRGKTGQQEPAGLWQKGAGCHQCSNTGYRGRLGVYELLSVTPAMSTALAAGDFETFASLARASNGYRPLDIAALDRAAEGLTSIEEAMRVAAEGILAGADDDEEETGTVTADTAAEPS